MKPTSRPKRTAEERAEEETVRRQHTANPIRQRPACAINRQSFAAILTWWPGSKPYGRVRD